MTGRPGKESGNQDPAAAGGARLPAGLPRSTRTVLLVLFFSSLFAALTTSFVASDFWWHLAFGRWIVEHHALPTQDPFDCTSAIFGASGQPRYFFTQYWLGQVVLYASYLLAGLKGAFVLRAAVFTLMFSLLYRLLRRAGAGLPSAVLLVALASHVIVKEIRYIDIRPQMWSSLFFVALLLLLENLREGRRWALFSLPAFMLLWANLHAGYVLGVIVIVIAAAAAFLAGNPRRRGILLAAAVAIAVTGANPAGYEAMSSFQAWRLAKPIDIAEEHPLYDSVALADLPATMPGLVVIAFLAVLALWPGRKSRVSGRWDRTLILLVTLAMGIKATRYLVFLVPAACWAATSNLAALRESLTPRGGWLPSRLRSPWLAGALGAVAVLALAASYARDAASKSVLWPSTAVPQPAKGAVDYLQGSGLKGNIFNLYALGGYLAWRLHPDMKVFIYGRMAFPELLTLYNEVMLKPSEPSSRAATGEAIPRYQQVLREYSVVAVVVPAGNSLDGDLFPLAWVLAHDKAWALTYAEKEALVFLRRAAAPAPLVADSLPRSAFYNNLIAVATAEKRGNAGRRSNVWLLSLALGYLGKGERQLSLRYFDEYLALEPTDDWARQARAVAMGPAALPTGR